MKKLILLIVIFQSIVSLPLYAEDSWVLWQKAEKLDFKRKEATRGVEWEIIDGFAKESDCKDHREQVWNNRVKFWDNMKGAYIKKVTSVPYTYIGTATKDYTLEFNYYCLPGSLDPRK